MNYSIAVKYAAVAGTIEPALCRKVIFTGVVGLPWNHTADVSALAIESEKPGLDAGKIETLLHEISYRAYGHGSGLFHTGDTDFGSEASRL